MALVDLLQQDPIALTVYLGVHHNFDVGQLTPGVRYFGHWLEYNHPAAKDAEAKTRVFLAVHFAKTSPNDPAKR
jgi:hypothetical protein